MVKKIPALVLPYSTYDLFPWIARASCDVRDVKIGTKSEGMRSYVLGQPETIPILLRILKVEFLVQLEVQFSAHPSVLRIE